MKALLAEARRMAWRLRTRHWFVYVPVPLQIITASAVHTFSVEVARSSAERNFGLSWRKRLPPLGGMLFVYPDAPVVEMWMQNTYLALDMVFVGPDGRIDHIARDLAPHAAGDFSSGLPTLAVLELAGGTSTRLGIAPGQAVACAVLAELSGA